jgi:hypothetical protein
MDCAALGKSYVLSGNRCLFGLTGLILIMARGIWSTQEIAPVMYAHGWCNCTMTAYAYSGDSVSAAGNRGYSARPGVLGKPFAATHPVGHGPASSASTQG